MGIVVYSTFTTLDQAYYDKRVRIKAAAKVIHPQFFEQADIIEKSHKGYFDLFNKLDATPATRLLTGTYDATDPTAETPTEAQVGITGYEYGNIVAYMQAPAATMTVSLNEASLRLIETNMAETLDNVAAYYLYAGTTAFDTIAGPLSTEAILKVLAKLEDTNIPRRDSNLYGAIISPWTKRDIFGDADALKGFVPIAKYADPLAVFGYELGAYLGFRWTVGSSAYHATTDGVRYDYPLFFGANAFGQVNGYDPTVVVSPQTSGLQRKTELGWKAQRGYGVIDTDAVKRLSVQPTPLVTS